MTLLLGYILLGFGLYFHNDAMMITSGIFTLAGCVAFCGRKIEEYLKDKALPKP